MNTFIYGLLMLSLLGTLQIGSVRADTDDTIKSLKDFREDNDEDIKSHKEKIEELEDEIEKMRKEAEVQLKKIEEFGDLPIKDSANADTGTKTKKYEKKISDDLPKEKDLDDKKEIEDYADKVKADLDEMKITHCQNKQDATNNITAHKDAPCLAKFNASQTAAKAVQKMMEKVPSGGKKENYLIGLYDLLETEKEKLETTEKLAEAIDNSIDGQNDLAELEDKNELLEDQNCDLEEDKNHFAYMAEGSMGNVNNLVATTSQALDTVNNALAVVGQANQNTYELMNWNYYSPFAGFKGHGYIPGYGQHDVHRQQQMPIGLQNFGPSMNIFQTPYLPQYEPTESYDDRNYQQMVWDV
ncbi:hypothetical protein N9N67_03570 [Bacteriovoracaceae bacterium]|nr:hypothetical protein [Bacteriovoracaceae bacterium]